MIWKYVVKGSGQCITEPDWDIPPAEITNRKEDGVFYAGGTCKLNPDTCGFYKPEPDNSNIKLRGFRRVKTVAQKKPKKDEPTQGVLF